MKITGLAATMALAALVVFSVPAWAADDGATLYNTRCAACHGVDGAGKPAARIPSLISDDARNASDAGLADSIANGGPSKKPPHAFQSKGVNPDQVRMIVAYIRELQKE